MSIFKYFTYDYWEERKRNKIAKEIDHLEQIVIDLDKYKTDNLMNEAIVDYCNGCMKVFKEEIKRLNYHL